METRPRAFYADKKNIWRWLYGEEWVLMFGFLVGRKFGMGGR